MGKQVYFYMLPEDEDCFISFARQRSGVVLIPELSRTEEPEVFDALPIPGGRDLGSDVLLWNRSSRVVVRHIPEHGYYAVDRMQSEVIEFVRSRSSNGTLKPGRLWCEPNAHDETFHPRPKSDDFKKWFESLVRWIRRNYERREQGYVGKHAIEWAALGGKLG